MIFQNGFTSLEFNSNQDICLLGSIDTTGNITSQIGYYQVTYYFIFYLSSFSFYNVSYWYQTLIGNISLLWKKKLLVYENAKLKYISVSIVVIAIVEINLYTKFILSSFTYSSFYIQLICFSNLIFFSIRNDLQICRCSGKYLSFLIIF